MGSVSQQRSEEAPSVGRRQQKGELMCLITYNTHACGPWHGKISSFMARARPSKSARGLSLRSFSCPIIAVVGRQATTNASFAPRRVDVPFHRIIPTPTTPSGVRSSPLMAAEVGVRRAEQREGPGQARVHVLFGRFASLDVIINLSVAPPSCRQRQAEAGRGRQAGPARQWQQGQGCQQQQPQQQQQQQAQSPVAPPHSTSSSSSHRRSSSYYICRCPPSLCRPSVPAGRHAQGGTYTSSSIPTTSSSSSSSSSDQRKSRSLIHSPTSSLPSLPPRPRTTPTDR